MENEKNKTLNFYRNQIYFADFSLNSLGSEQYGVRPCIVVQNYIGNHYSPNLIVVPLTTSHETDSDLGTHLMLKQSNYNLLNEDSTVLTEQIRTISKERIVDIDVKGNSVLSLEDVKQLNMALNLSLGKHPIEFKREPTIKRGEIYLADLGKGKQFEVAGLQYVLILQNDVGNFFSPTTIIAPISFHKRKSLLPTQTYINPKIPGVNISRSGIVHLEQITTIDKKRIISKIGKLPADIISRVEKSIMTSISLDI